MKGKKREKLIISVIGLFLILAVMTGTSLAVPNTINYQGYLTNNTGSPIDGTVNITFSIYDTDVEGSAEWFEVHDGGGSNPPAVSVSNGIFSVILGETNPIAASCLVSGNCYLGVWVEGELEEMSPRQKLTGVAYSIRAGLAESAVSVENVTASTADPDNTFVEVDAGSNNSGGYNNTFIGNLAGGSNTTGDHNTFLGFYAGGNSTTGENNTFIGDHAGTSNTASDNTFIGQNAGYNNTTGTYNTFIGQFAGMDNITANNNTFIGMHTGSNNTAGQSNFHWICCRMG